MYIFKKILDQAICNMINKTKLGRQNFRGWSQKLPSNIPYFLFLLR